MPPTCLSSLITNGLAVADSFAIWKFLASRGCQNLKNLSSSKLTRVGIFLSLTVSGYHIITISKSFGCSKTPISGFRHSVYPAARACGRNLGLKISPIECPWKVTLYYKAATNTSRAIQVLRPAALACGSSVGVDLGSNLTTKLDSRTQISLPLFSGQSDFNL